MAKKSSNSTYPSGYWKPRRRGAVYCSPGCGRKCTYKEYLTAKRTADELVKRLGKGWKPRIWENMGWHVSVATTDGKWFVHVNKSGIISPATYSAGFDEDGRTGASNFWVTAKTPEAAIKKSWAMIVHHVNKFTPPPRLP